MKIFVLTLACSLAISLPSLAADKLAEERRAVQADTDDKAHPFEDVAPQAGSDAPSPEAPPTLELTPQDEEAAALFSGTTPKKP